MPHELEDYPGRFPPRANVWRVVWPYVGLAAVLLALSVTSTVADRTVFWLGLGAAGVLGLGVFGVSAARGIRQNWISFGEVETTLSIKGEVTTLTNDDVKHVWWTWNNLGSDAGTRLVLQIGATKSEAIMSLSRRQRRRALVRANETFHRAVFEFDNDASLVPGTHWGPGKPIPDLRARARWRNRARGRSFRASWAGRGPGRHRTTSDDDQQPS